MTTNRCATVGRWAVAAVLVGLSSCGDDPDDGATAPSAASATAPESTTGRATSAPGTSTTASGLSGTIPDWDAACAAGVERAQQQLPTGELVRVLEASDSRALCIVRDGHPGARPVPLGDQPVLAAAPELRSAGSSQAPGLYHLFALPAGFPVVTAHDEAGTPLLTAQTADRRHMLILDIGVSNAGPDVIDMVTRQWTLIDTAGSVAATVDVLSPPAGSAPTDLLEVLACLRRAGLDLPDPRTMNVDEQGRPATSSTTVDSDRTAQPFPPEVASSAWATCRDLQLEALRDQGMPAAEIDSIIGFLDCMASQGWIQSFLGDITDRSAHEAATATCQGRAPHADIALTCDAFIVGPDGAIAAAPVRTGVRGNLSAALIEAPLTAVAGQPFVVNVPSVSLRLAATTETFDVVAQHDFVRRFQVAGGEVTAGSARYLTPTPTDVATSDATQVNLATAASGAGGTDFTFAPAQFEVRGATPGTDVTVSMIAHESTLDLAAADRDGSALTIRVVCTPDPNILATTTLTP